MSQELAQICSRELRELSAIFFRTEVLLLKQVSPSLVTLTELGF